MDHLQWQPCVQQRFHLWMRACLSKKMVAGIAMGMMSDDKGNYKILTDIQGPEDHYGDMDFKVAGSRDGISAVQMDVKNKWANSQDA